MSGLLFGQTSSCQRFVRDAGCRTRVELWQMRYDPYRVPAHGEDSGGLSWPSWTIGSLWPCGDAGTRTDDRECRGGQTATLRAGRPGRIRGARVLITRRGRPMAKLVPPDDAE